jgi:hypothetical protein
MMVSQDEHNTSELRAIEGGLETLGRAMRDEPALGFEARLADAAARAARGEGTLRLVSHEGGAGVAKRGHESGRRMLGPSVRRAGVVAACLLLVVVVAFMQRVAGSGGASLKPDGSGVAGPLVVASVSEADFDELVSALELWHDEALSGAFDALQRETSLLEASVETAWSGNWTTNVIEGDLFGEDSL